MTTFAQALAIARPALAKKPYVRHYMHFLCSNNMVVACDDRLGIRVVTSHPLNCCVPGVEFINAFTDGAELKQQSSNVTIKHGSSTSKVPTLPAAEYPLLWPVPTSGEELELSPNFIKALAICMQGAGKDEDRPEFLGVTIIPNTAHGPALVSTDNITITSCAIDVLSGNLSAPVVLPDPFCRALIAAHKGTKLFITLTVTESKVFATIGDIGIFCSTPTSAPWDYAGMMAKLNKQLAGVSSGAVPADWQERMQRVLAVLGNKSHLGAPITSGQRGITVYAERDGFSASEFFQFDGTPPNGAWYDPRLLARAPKEVTSMQFGPTFLMMQDNIGALKYVVSASSSARKTVDASYDAEIPY